MKNKIDSNKIEEKALNCFRSYLEKSNIIKPIITNDDKIPIWDGELYVYSSHEQDNNHFSCVIPVQVKGKIIDKLSNKSFKYSIRMCDLKAYLYKPTIYIVCQIENDTDKKKLFYCEFLPISIKKIYEAKEKQHTVSVEMTEIPESIEEFENILKVFSGNSRRQLGIIGSKPYTAEDVISKGITEFSVEVPKKNGQPLNEFELFVYLSTHYSYIYPKIDKEHNISGVLGDGKFIIQTTSKIERPVYANGNKYFNYYSLDFNKKGIIIHFGNDLIFEWPNDYDSRGHYKISFKSHFLSEAMNDVKFLIALSDTNSLTLGDKTFNLKLEDNDLIVILKDKLSIWEDIHNFLTRLHVKKDLDLNKINSEQLKNYDLVKGSIFNKVPIVFQSSENLISYDFRLGNVDFILLGYRIDKNRYLLKDFFSPEVFATYDYMNETIKVSSFTYLQNGHKWGEFDNIPYDEQIPTYNKYAKGNEKFLDISTFDLNSMLLAYDSITDKDRKDQLSVAIVRLDNWLFTTDKREANRIIHEIDHLQIIKRQRKFTNEELEKLNKYLNDDNIESYLRVEVSLLLDDNDHFELFFAKCSEEDKHLLQTWPIWRFKK